MEFCGNRRVGFPISQPDSCTIGGANFQASPGELFGSKVFALFGHSLQQTVVATEVSDFRFFQNTTKSDTFFRKLLQNIAIFFGF